MASFKRLPSGLWQAQVFRRGIRRSASFPNKGAAVACAGTVEAEIMAGFRGDIPNLTFSDLLDRYLKDVSPSKKGHRWEEVRISLLKRDRIAQVRLKALDAVQVAAWRNRRLQAVSSPSVRREWNLLSHACNVALREWKWLTHNPFREVRRPKSAKHRERLITEADLSALRERATTPAREQTFRALEVGMETGMRASEILSNPPVQGRVAYLADTKNGTSRHVPLSERAVALLADSFTISPGVMDAMFRAMRDEAGIKDLHFHDSRHTACTRLSKKLNILQLQKMLGIKDPRILQVYFNESAEDIAKNL